jgi:hypothetical protein
MVVGSRSKYSRATARAVVTSRVYLSWTYGSRGHGPSKRRRRGLAITPPVVAGGVEIPGPAILGNEKVGGRSR